jgi:alcohol dehydrogenase class IV
MAMGSMLAGMAFANSGLGLVHGLVHPIGARLGVAHGVACGRLLPGVLRFNATAVPAKVAEVGAALTREGELSADEAVSAVEELVRDVGVPVGISDLSISSEQMESLARDGLVSGAVKTNPRAVGEADARAVLEKARRAD